MRCDRCGKDIGVGSKCPFCGAGRRSNDPFVTLSDIVTNESEANIGEYPDNPTNQITKTDCFSSLGDLVPGDDCFEGVICANTDSAGSCTDPFRPLGNLDDSPSEPDVPPMDTPAAGGFEPMDELVHSGDESEDNAQEYTQNTDDRNSTTIFVWKKWMTIAVCCIPLICLMLWTIFWGSAWFPYGKYSKESAEKVLGQTLEMPILEVDTEGIETPMFLHSIESRNGYEILSFERTQTGAVATMRVFAPDVYGVAKKLDSCNTYTDTDELADALDVALKNAPIVEKQVVVEYTLTEDGYAPILTAEFIDAYYGGIYQLRDEAIANAAMEG